MKKLLFVLAVFSATLIYCQRTVRIEGKVTDVNSGKPIAGARVLHVALDTVVFTDSTGHYALPPAPSRTGTIVFNAADYQPFEVEFKPRAGKATVSLDVELEPSPLKVIY